MDIFPYRVATSIKTDMAGIPFGVWNAEAGTRRVAIGTTVFAMKRTRLHTGNRYPPCVAAF